MSEKKLEKRINASFIVTNMMPGYRSDLREDLKLLGIKYGVDVKISQWEESPPKLCENCGRDESVGIHWDDLDGPNRAGWGCSK